MFVPFYVFTLRPTIVCCNCGRTEPRRDVSFGQVSFLITHHLLIGILLVNHCSGGKKSAKLHEIQEHHQLNELRLTATASRHNSLSVPDGGVLIEEHTSLA